MPDYGVGKPFSIEDLRKTAPSRKANPRDDAITKAIRAAAAAPASEVIPMTFPSNVKVTTVVAAARRIAAEQDLNVNVGVNKSYPNTVLFSRAVLSRRGRKPS